MNSDFKHNFKVLNINHNGEVGNKMASKKFGEEL